MWVKGVGEAPSRKGRSLKTRNHHPSIPEKMGDDVSNVGMEKIKGRVSTQGVGL